MACDLWLMEQAKLTGQTTLRVYSWLRPTVSFGRNERARNFYSAKSLAACNLDAVRRPTGGRALLHNREVTYSVTMPIPSAISWQLAYNAVNQILLTAVQTLGVPASIVESAAATVSSSLQPGAPCFAGASRGEIAVAGAKLVASAVWRDRDTFLQQGSILLHDDQMLLTTIADAGIPLPKPAATLSELLPTVPPFDSVADAIEAAARQHVQTVVWAPSTSDAVAIGGVRERLGQSSWLWRS
ncbi:MAG: hypothetical protein M3Y64_04035 [Gemmatimonadota bacterium]|nr:hypothetical protein [Gemmatimonadota bacterium]